MEVRVKKWIYRFVLLSFLWGCSQHEEKIVKHDFEALMGRDFPAWKYVQTPEDYENLQFFKNNYEENIPFIEMKSTLLRIPKIIHYIWIGPRPFPRESIENVRGWIAKHPDWTIKFWTDRDRPLPHKQMQLARIQDLHFFKLFDCYKKSDNYAEKSDLLRYEILYQEGGIFVDHGVKCFQSFEPLCRAFDLFCGMEMPHPTSLSSSILPANHLVGSRAGHPILKRSMEWLDQEWDRLEQEYRGQDRNATMNRMAHRTLFIFGDSFKRLANKESNRDIALPAFYFNAPDERLAIFARHLNKETWFKNESEFEKLVRERLMKISKKTNKILLIFGVFSFVNMICFAILFMKYRKNAQRAA